MKGKTSPAERDRLPGMRCPNCNRRMKAFRSDALTPTFREIAYRCTNSECDLSFVASLSPVRLIRPPLVEKPGFNLGITGPPKAQAA